MPSPLAMQQIGPSPGKRTAMMMECGSADLLSPAKRVRSAPEWHGAGGVGAGMENLAPSLWAAAVPGGWAPAGAWQVHASCGMQHTQSMMQQHPCGYSVEGEYYARREEGGMMDVHMSAGANHAGGDGMEMDHGEASRFERFPPTSTHSPTHWHKGNALGVPEMVPYRDASAMTSDESTVRTWECGYGGKSDFY